LDNYAYNGNFYPIEKPWQKMQKQNKGSLANDEDDFDVIIIDTAVTPEFVARLKPCQRVSQFPGILALANKAKMSRKLKKMRKMFPEDYDFFP